MQENIIILKTVHDGDNISADQFQENVVTLSKSVTENCMQRPLAEISRRRLSGLQIKTLLCRKRCMIDENFLMNTYMKSGSFYQIPSARTIKSTLWWWKEDDIIRILQENSIVSEV